MKKHILTITLLLFFISLSISAAKVDTVVTYSPAMKKAIKALVVTPDTYNDSKSFPVF